ncbi:hypothetical protein Syun_004145 [Stephania yunnanensis]|uniref:Uncharacterized protein n=1 Tax=Stephania yunnanensis TaxID=152371 RepID=A0AAP0L2G9_9MAGN
MTTRTTSARLSANWQQSALIVLGGGTRKQRPWRSGWSGGRIETLSRSSGSRELNQQLYWGKDKLNWDNSVERIAAAKAVRSAADASTTARDAWLSQPQLVGNIDLELENPERTRKTASPSDLSLLSSFRNHVLVDIWNGIEGRRYLKCINHGIQIVPYETITRHPEKETVDLLIDKAKPDKLRYDEVNWDNTSKGSPLISEIAFYNKTLRYLDVIELHNPE